MGLSESPRVVVLPSSGCGKAIVGNHYAIRHADPWRTALEVVAELPSLEQRTIRAIAAIVDSSAPPSIREAALFNISTLRSQTVFQTADGQFYGWEGVSDRGGAPPGDVHARVGI